MKRPYVKDLAKIIKGVMKGEVINKRIGGHTTFKELGCDEMDVMEVVMDCEKVYDVGIHDDWLPKGRIENIKRMKVGWLKYAINSELSRK